MARRLRILQSVHAGGGSSPSKQPVVAARKILRTATGPEVQARARKYGYAALKSLYKVLLNPLASDMSKISAAATLLERGYGKPTQTNINATVNSDGKPNEINDQELNRRIKETLQRVEGLTKRKREKIESEERPPDIRQLH